MSGERSRGPGSRTGPQQAARYEGVRAMSDVVPAEAVDTYLSLALAGEQGPAISYVLDLLHPATSSMLITDLLAPVQREVGERWHRGELSTADEHLVTGVSDSTLTALSAAMIRPGLKGLVLVTSAEGDWHCLAARMFAEQLRDAGREVLYLGPSAPSEDVAAFIARRRPEAVTVTCNLASSYVGTARVVDAAHAHGVPVLAGGRALDLQRALHLGSDAWARDATNAVRVLDQWRGRTPIVDHRPVQLDGGALALDARAVGIGGSAFEELARQLPSQLEHGRYPPARIHADLVDTVRHLAAARLVDDAAVFVEFQTWLRELYLARGLAGQLVEMAAGAVHPYVAEVDTTAADLLSSA